MAEDHHTSHGHSMLDQRASGLAEHHHLADRETGKLRPLLLLAIALLGIIVVSLHAVGGMLLVKTGLGGFSLHNPVSYALIGLPLVAALFKLKHVVGFMRRKGK